MIKFGLIYEICRPEPFDGWMSEPEAYWQALEQIALADELGFDHVWEVEHHFLEGYSLSSASAICSRACQYASGSDIHPSNGSGRQIS